MNVRNIINHENIENEITKLSEKIMLQINALDKKIAGSPSDHESVLVWTQKKNVLEAALDYLSGKDVDLEMSLQINPRYKDEWSWLSGWHSGSSGETIKLLNEVNNIKAVLTNLLVTLTAEVTPEECDALVNAWEKDGSLFSIKKYESSSKIFHVINDIHHNNQDRQENFHKQLYNALLNIYSGLDAFIFISLTKDIMDHIIGYLTLPEMANARLVCRRWCYSHDSLFQQRINEYELLQYAMDANPDALKKYLQRYDAQSSSGLIVKRFPGIERCGRVWKSVSVLEFLAWAGDMFPLIRLISDLPDKFVQEAINQLINVRDKGLEHGSHMAPFHALINASEYHESNFSYLCHANEIEKSCFEIIGGAQSHLPCFGLQWLCEENYGYSDNIAREPRRTFILDKKPWNKEYTIDLEPSRSHFVNKKTSSPYTAEGLGVSFYIIRGCTGVGVSSDVLYGKYAATGLEALCQMSAAQLDQIIASLQQRISATNKVDKLSM